MNRKEYQRKLREWEVEGYDVSELREKWFPTKKAVAESTKYKWLTIILTILVVVAGVVVWQAWQEVTPAIVPTTTLAPKPAPVPEKVELKWDDGYAESSPGITRQEVGFLVSFSPPATPFSIETVKIFGLLQGTEWVGKEFVVQIWNNEQEVVYSSTYPISQFNVTTTDQWRKSISWIEVEVPYIQVKDDFYIHVYTDVKWISKGGFHIGADASTLNEHSDVTFRTSEGIYKVSDVWPYNQEKWFGDKSKVNWMIRVIGAPIPAPTPVPSINDYLVINSISPPNDTYLNAGQIVKVTAEISYSLTSLSEAEIILLFLKEGTQYPIFTRHVVKEGSGDVTVTGQFQVPDLPRVPILAFLQGLSQPQPIINITAATYLTIPPAPPSALAPALTPAPETAAPPGIYVNSHLSHLSPGHFSPGYQVELWIQDPSQTIKSASVTGPGISGSLSLEYGIVRPNYWRYKRNIMLGTSPPDLPLVYTFTIIDKGGNTYVLQDEVLDHVEGFATNLSPSGRQTITDNLVFSWTGIDIPGVKYRVLLYDGEFNRIWVSPYTMLTSLIYDGPALTSGWYFYYIGAYSELGPSSLAYQSFEVVATDTSPSVEKEKIELIYDVGEIKRFSAQGPGWGHSVHFSPPATPFTISMVKVLVGLYGTEYTDQVALLEIWDEDFSVLYSREMPATEFSEAPYWITVETNIVIDGDFRVVFFTGSGGQEGGISIGYDLSGNKASEVVKSDGTIVDWPPQIEDNKPEEKTNWMIRVIGMIP